MIPGTKIENIKEPIGTNKNVVAAINHNKYKDALLNNKV